MPAFEYQAVDAQGRRQRGVLQADTARAARQLLRERALLPLEVDAVTSSRRTALWQPRLSARELALLTRQLATLLKAGLPVDEALGAVAEQSESRLARRILAELRARVVEGSSLAAAMLGFESSFPEMYRASVLAGEQSGQLDVVLARLAEHVERGDDLRQRVWLALAYPLLLLGLSLALVAALMTWVVPQLIEVFAGMGQRLPPLTRGLIVVSDFVQAWGLALLVGFTALLVAAAVLLRQPGPRRRFQALLLGLPLFGSLLRGAATARFARTLALLSGSAVPVLDALRIAAEVLGNLPMRDAVREVALRVREGSGLARALGASGLFPPIAVHLVASGERSGQLEPLLEQLALYQEREVESRLGALMAVLGPLAILMVGGLVLLIVLAILLPIFDQSALLR